MATQVSTPGPSLERCRSALGAVNALIVGAAPGERRSFLRLEQYWLEQERAAKAEGR